MVVVGGGPILLAVHAEAHVGEVGHAVCIRGRAHGVDEVLGLWLGDRSWSGVGLWVGVRIRARAKGADGSGPGL